MFLQTSSSVIPTFEHDYPEWHKGRQYYSLWYLEIKDPHLLGYLEQLREEFSDILYLPNTHQFHITLYICGFKTEQIKTWQDDFDTNDLNQQIEIINQLKLKPFKLKTLRLNSFQSALFLEIDDSNGSLDLIRNRLATTTEEIAALKYFPHITIGLYRKAIASDLVLQRIESFTTTYFEFEQKELIYGTYQSQLLQGELQSYIQIKLGKS